jgi:cysteine protease ATG4
MKKRTCRKDKDSSSRSGIGDEEVHVKERDDEEQEQEQHRDEEDSDGDFFDAGEGATIDGRVLSRAASKSGQSEADTEDDLLGPMTPGPTTTPTISSTPVKPKAPGKSRPHAVSFMRTVSASTEGEGDLDDEEWVDPTSVPATPLDATPPSKALFQKSPDTGAASVPRPPGMAKTKSSSSNGRKSRKHRKEGGRAPAISPSVSVPFPTSPPPSTQPSSQNRGGAAAGKGAAAVRGPGGEDGEDLSRHIPPMSTARARDGGRTQSGGVRGVIAPFEPGAGPGPERHEPEPEPGPELELVEADPDADGF